MDAPNGEGKSATGKKLTVITLVFDHETSLVHMDMADVKVSLAQMVVHEAVTQLEIIRRQAAAVELQRQLTDQARAQALANSVMGKR